MSWKEVLDIILIVCLFGSLFNIFVGAEIESEFPRLKERWVFVIIGILYVLEAFGTYKIMMYDKELNDERNRTAYVIHIEPDGETCEGRFYSGKNCPITVKCLDGRTYIAQSIQVIKKIKLKHPVK